MFEEQGVSGNQDRHLVLEEDGCRNVDPANRIEIGELSGCQGDSEQEKIDKVFPLYLQEASLSSQQPEEQ